MRSGDDERATSAEYKIEIYFLTYRYYPLTGDAELLILNNILLQSRDAMHRRYTPSEHTIEFEFGAF